ncbi:phosphofructokinase [Mycolicibacterium agri]|uniref:Phosphofructokinase n=1 Tax=Mycolicibacterium agri TaxID=36811 RepID=A0A2A7MT04_MYCAG|nr:1-phosphofructokinase family hexose kinase [Mycolicibacterium agri]PEG34845.1 phosphofructokinase [Mycolicibacterium agri]GFG50304.1 putative ATP-dependent 6-phosphofructokinase isozyme 2 [Mycolicibacterium agri]
MAQSPTVNGQTSIVTLTMNPALDITTAADVVRHTDKIRCDGARYDAGGGGINVARFARVLGASVTAVFPAGGATGAVVTDLVAEADVSIQRVDIGSPTRESFTVNERSTSKQYRFVLPGPRLRFAEQGLCLDLLRKAAATAGFVVASGSLPPGVPPNFYQRVADICREADARLILDTSGTGLTHVRSNVFLVKPSVRELRECVGRTLDTEGEQLGAAHELIDRGMAQVVVVSLGADGALLVTADENKRFSAIPVQAVSGVGAGDAMVAAIAVGLSYGWSLSKSVRFGIAAATAKLLTPGTAACSRADVERFFEQSREPTDITAVSR